MAQKNRDILKNFFRKGNLPGEGQFAHLIDSMVNRIDDGISSTPEDGLRIIPQGDQGRLISFFAKDDANIPMWSIRLDNANNILSIKNRAGKSVFSANGDGFIGLGTDSPQTRLDVSGVVSMTGRRGIYTGEQAEHNGPVVVPADGKWHKILTHLDGCRGFEVVAGSGVRKTGRYALMHAIALNCFNGRRSKIKKVHATYRWFWQRIALKWTGNMHDYDLEVKTWMNYGDGAVIKCNITEIWHDPFLSDDETNRLPAKGAR